MTSRISDRWITPSPSESYNVKTLLLLLLLPGRSDGDDIQSIKIEPTVRGKENNNRTVNKEIKIKYLLLDKPSQRKIIEAKKTLFSYREAL